MESVGSKWENILNIIVLIIIAVIAETGLKISQDWDPTRTPAKREKR